MSSAGAVLPSDEAVLAGSICSDVIDDVIADVIEGVDDAIEDVDDVIGVIDDVIADPTSDVVAEEPLDVSTCEGEAVDVMTSRSV